MTHPYYVFLEAGMSVDVASIKGGEIPIDPQSFYRPIISAEDKRFLEDPTFQAKVKNSIPIKQVDISQYDTIFLAGGWGQPMTWPSPTFSLKWSAPLGMPINLPLLVPYATAY